MALKDNLQKVSLIVSLLSTAAALGTLLYINVIHKSPKIKNEEELKKMHEEAGKELAQDAFKLDRLIINLNSNKNKLRFLECSAHFIPFKAEQIALLEKSQAVLQDIFIDTASKMEAEELNSIAGKILLEDRLKRGINAKLGEPMIKKILFSSFVVQ